MPGSTRLTLNVVAGLLTLAMLSGPIGPPARAEGPTLALVYVVTPTDGPTGVWAAEPDGANPRHVADLPAGFRPLALRGRQLALAERPGRSGPGGPALVLVDLVSGQQRRVPAPQEVRSATIGPNGQVFFTGRVGCGPDFEPTGLWRYDPESVQSAELRRFESAGLEILRYDPEFHELTLLPRGCDPGFGQVLFVDSDTGEERNRVDARGCGWAAVAPDGIVIVTTWQACGAGSDPFPAAQLYSLRDDTRRDVRFGSEEGLADGPPLFTPDGSRIAVGRVKASGRAGEVTSQGIWLIDPASGAAQPLWQDGGRQALPIAWSPDGTALLTAAERADGSCAFVAVRLADGTTRPITTRTSACRGGVTVLGWSALD